MVRRGLAHWFLAWVRGAVLLYFDCAPGVGYFLQPPAVGPTAFGVARARGKARRRSSRVYLAVFAAEHLARRHRWRKADISGLICRRRVHWDFAFIEIVTTNRIAK
jgi:hypothetical protein